MSVDMAAPQQQARQVGDWTIIGEDGYVFIEQGPVSLKIRLEDAGDVADAVSRIVRVRQREEHGEARGRVMDMVDIFLACLAVVGLCNAIARLTGAK